MLYFIRSAFVSFESPSVYFRLKLPRVPRCLDATFSGEQANDFFFVCGVREKVGADNLLDYKLIERKKIKKKWQNTDLLLLLQC